MREVTAIPLLINRSYPVPYYYQLAQILEQAIADGSLPQGGWIESEAKLAERSHLSIPTVRHAIELLVAKKLLIRRSGIGTQIHRDRAPDPGTRKPATTQRNEG